MLEPRKEALGLLGAPADIANLAAKGIDYLKGSNLQQYTQPVAEKLGGAGLQKAVEAQTGPFYQPQGMLEQGGNILAQFLPAMIGGPETLATKLMTRVALPAAGSELAGAATAGTPLEGPARVTGAVLGATSPLAISRAISPTTIKNAAAVDTLQNSGVTALTAGQKSGSKAVQYAESELGDAMGAGGRATAMNELAHEQYTAAVGRPAGIEASRITPDILNQAYENTGAKFDAVAKAAGDIPLGNFATTGQKVLQDYKDLTNQDSALLTKLYNRITNPAEQVSVAGQANPNAAFTKMSAAEFNKMMGAGGQAAPTISGETYQAIRSDILKNARATSSPELKLALGDMRNALDIAVQKGLTDPKLADAWLAARQEYKNLLIVDKALNKGGEFAPNGLITPAALRQAASSVDKRAFTRGQSPYTDLAKAGEQVMKTLPQSGTAPRAAAHFIPSLIGGALGFGAHGLGGIVGGVAGPAIMGRTLMSGPFQRYMSNQSAVPCVRFH